ncbi:hypothetical protein B0T25DRAFT_516548 [Lasiosphaeria hispida]|uniref:DUF7907 domain-containing protein n=1 Tax=Lasiosphaeria hispida TaxID=260671 RepID=A0AAJ0HLY9_9PEZI|nr:hypothetical protein B0T25DRAFT_516548 [Lasiosphaeria hispida]
MKSTFFAGALAALTSSASVVSAQTYNQTGPFFLQVKSDNATLNGRYLYACHSGAAQETLCIGKVDTPATNRASASFFWNTTVYEGEQSPVGALIWNLALAQNPDGTSMVVSSPMTLDYTPGTNVATTRFGPSEIDRSVQVGFNNSVMYMTWWNDDSTFLPGQYPTGGSSREITNWNLCWVLAGSYYYNALAWVTSGAPHNPTCEAVSVVKVEPSA